MIAGRELDMLVAEKVMGQTSEVRERWRGGCLCGRSETCDVCEWPAPYSTDIASAWLVVEKFKGSISLKHETKWGAQFWPNDFAYAQAAPLAICLAALAAAEAIVWCRAREAWVLNASPQPRP